MPRVRSSAVLVAMLLPACAGVSRSGPQPVPYFESGAAKEATVPGVRWPTEGYRRPAVATPQCVQRTFRLPAQSGIWSGTMTARFAVLADGSVAHFAVSPPSVPQPIAAALRDAVHACRWIPGADPEGNPAAIVVLLPFHISPG